MKKEPQNFEKSTPKESAKSNEKVFWQSNLPNNDKAFCQLKFGADEYFAELKKINFDDFYNAL